MKILLVGWDVIYDVVTIKTLFTKVYEWLCEYHLRILKLVVTYTSL